MWVKAKVITCHHQENNLLKLGKTIRNKIMILVRKVTMIINLLLLLHTLIHGWDREDLKEFKSVDLICFHNLHKLQMQQPMAQTQMR